MTPKEKAQELFVLYRFALSIQGAPLGDIKDVLSKQCALIAVDEAIKVSEWYEVRYKTNSVINYWQEVRSEIEKI